MYLNHDDSDIFYECTAEEPSTYRSITIFKGFKMRHPRSVYSVAAHELPPRSFMINFKNILQKQSTNYSLLAWLLNSPQVKLKSTFAYHENALSIFLMNERKDYNICLDILRDSSEIKPEISLDATLVNTSLDQEDDATFICSISPIPQQKTEYDRFKMELLIEDYKRQLKKILKTYATNFTRRNKFASKYMQQSLTLVTRAYIRDLFYDITFKYASLKHLKTYQKMQLLKELQQNHKSETFLISSNGISEFITNFDQMACYSGATTLNKGSKLTYGVWFDAERGIILLCNGIVSNWDMIQLPTYAYKVNDNIHNFVMKYMLFLNMSVVETCLWHF